MFIEELNGVHCPGKCSRLIAKIIMDISGGTVQAERNHLDPAFLYFEAGFFGDQCSIGRQTHTHSKSCTVCCNVEYVLPKQWLST